MQNGINKAGQKGCKLAYRRRGEKYQFRSGGKLRYSNRYVDPYTNYTLTDEGT